MEEHPLIEWRREGGREGGAKTFVQTSSGEIKELEANTVYDVLSPGVYMRSWLEMAE